MLLNTYVIVIVDSKILENDSQEIIKDSISFLQKVETILTKLTNSLSALCIANCWAWVMSAPSGPLSAAATRFAATSRHVLAELVVFIHK